MRKHVLEKSERLLLRIREKEAKVVETCNAFIALEVEGEVYVITAERDGPRTVLLATDEREAFKNEETIRDR